jgi:tetratricopeptide (TPR) repeat protein
LARLASGLDTLHPLAGGPDAASAATRLEAAGASTAEEWAMVARAHLAASRDTDALTAAERALARCPDYAAAHYLAGKAADRLGQGDKAAAEYRRALDGNEGFIPPRYNLALLQLKAGDSAGAAATLDEVIARRADARALLLRGQARLNLADLAGAEADLREVVRLDPNMADGWALLGTVHARKGDSAAASRAFCRGKELGSAAAAANCRE